MDAGAQLTTPEIVAHSPARAQKRHLRRPLLALCALLVLLCLLTPVALVVARVAMSRGAHQMQLAQISLQTPNVERSPHTALSSAQGSIQSASRDFRLAHLLLFPYGALLPHLSWVPVVGSQLAAAPAAAAMADDAATGIRDMLQGLQPLLSSFDRRQKGAHVPVPLLVRQLAAGTPQFSHACSSLSAARTERRDIAAGSLPSFASSLHTVDRQLPRLLSMCHGLLLIPPLLGYGHQQSYLLAYQNEDQIRASGGFLGSFGLLTMRDGKATQRFHGTGLRDNLSLPPPEPMAIDSGEPGWLFRDSNWSPDFPTTAALERFFLQLDLHQRAANVIDITQQAAADILTATGPIYSPEYRRWITGSNVAQLANFYTHDTETGGPLRYRNAELQRKQFILIVAKHLFERLHQLSLTQLIHLANQMTSDIARRDIQLNFADSREQALVRDIGADGAVKGVSSDYLFVVDSNLSYNKINPYVHESVSYHATIQPTRWLQAQVTLRFQNTPAPHLLQSGSGPGAGKYSSWDDYADYIRLFVPPGAQLLSESGWTQRWSPGAAYGKTEFSGYLIVRRGQTRTVQLTYLVPPNVFTWSGGRRYRLFVQHQAGGRLDQLSVAVSDQAGRTS
ncbi:MAG TPA: DUF4012 domain-containing protein, partial [Chloroflexota bacterium]